MGRRVLNRKEMRNDFDAAERTTAKEEEETEDEEEGDEDEDEEEGEEGAEPSEDGEAAAEDDDDEADDDDGDDDDEDGPKKKKKKKAKAKPVAKAKPKSRARTAKVVRMRVVWGVFSNSHQMVASYEYSKKADAEAHVARLIADKKTTHFLQPVKEPIEEKKEK